MKTEPIYKVFTLSEGDKVKYVGVTTKSVQRRLTEMSAQSRAKNTQYYTLAVSGWLREMRENFKVACYQVVLETRDKKAAYEKKVALNKEHGISTKPVLFKETK